jgi:hypothetical protein
VIKDNIRWSQSRK